MVTTTQADQQLLERINRFDKSPRTVTMDEPAQLIIFENGQWQLLGMVARGQRVNIGPDEFPVQAGPVEVERILHLIPPPAVASNERRIAEALWNLLVELGGDPQIYAIRPMIRDRFEDASKVLEETGWSARGRGFIPHERR